MSNVITFPLGEQPAARSKAQPIAAEDDPGPASEYPQLRIGFEHEESAHPGRATLLSSAELDPRRLGPAERRAYMQHLRSLFGLFGLRLTDIRLVRTTAYEVGDGTFSCGAAQDKDPAAARLAHG